MLNPMTKLNITLGLITGGTIVGMYASAMGGVQQRIWDLKKSIAQKSPELRYDINRAKTPRFDFSKAQRLERGLKRIDDSLTLKTLHPSWSATKISTHLMIGRP